MRAGRIERRRLKSAAYAHLAQALGSRSGSGHCAAKFLLPSTARPQNARIMSRPLPLEFIASIIAVEQLPASRTEIAFIGRSNVGKSSLLNALAGQKKLARVSNTPGRTQVLNSYRLGATDTTVIDCPGYGYADAPKAIRARFEPMVEQYLLEREVLQMVMLLVDGEIGPTKSDLEMLDWLREHALPHVVIATKLDKVKQSRRGARQHDFALKCATDPANVLWVSADKNVGITELRERVGVWLA